MGVIKIKDESNEIKRILTDLLGKGKSVGKLTINEIVEAFGEVELKTEQIETIMETILNMQIDLLSEPDEICNANTNDLIQEENRFDNEYMSLVTLGGKKKVFYWELSSDFNIIITRSFKNNKVNCKLINNIVLEELNQRIDFDFWTPLANNIEKLKNSTERYGIGQILVEDFGFKPEDGQLASHIAAIFCKANIWQSNGKLRNMEFKKVTNNWKIKLELLIKSSNI